MSDTDFSPKPPKGRKWYWARRNAVHVKAKPFYDTNVHLTNAGRLVPKDGVTPRLTLHDLEHIKVREGSYWHLAWDFGFWHGYVGYIPINAKDRHGFFWKTHPQVAPLIAENKLFVHLPDMWMRMGIGEWS